MTMTLSILAYNKLKWWVIEQNLEQNLIGFRNKIGYVFKYLFEFGDDGWFSVSTKEDAWIDLFNKLDDEIFKFLKLDNEELQLGSNRFFVSDATFVVCMERGHCVNRRFSVDICLDGFPVIEPEKI